MPQSLLSYLRYPLVLLLCGAAHPAQEGPDEAAHFSLRDLVVASSGRLAVYAHDGRSGTEIAHNAGMRMACDAHDRLRLAVAAGRLGERVVGGVAIEPLLDALVAGHDRLARDRLASLVGEPATGRSDASPKEIARLLVDALAPAVPGPMTRAVRDALAHGTPPCLADTLPFHLPAWGLDVETERNLMSVARFPCDGSSIVICIMARDYAHAPTARTLMARMARAVIGTIDPTALVARPLDPQQVRGLRQVVLLDGARHREVAASVPDPLSAIPSRAAARRTTFRIREDALVAVVLTTDEPRALGVRWTLPDGTRRVQRFPVPGHSRGVHELSLPLRLLGRHEVEVAIDGGVVLHEHFQVLRPPKAR